jgi:hypothetical protein
MMMFRRLAHAVLVPALLAGCSQSLFDDGAGNGDAGTPGAPDAALPMTGPDGGDNGRDGGGNRPDAGVEPPDAAAPRDLCPSPCAGDAFGDFSDQQGGENGRWRYIEVRPEPPAAPYFDMMDTILPGSVEGWIGTGAFKPTIGLCAADTSETTCFELAGRVSLTSPSNTLDVYRPALVWTAEVGGIYELTGDWVVSSQAPESAVELTIDKNVFEETPVSDTATQPIDPRPFEASIELEAGDQLVLSAQTLTEVGVTVGVSFFVTGPRDP